MTVAAYCENSVQYVAPDGFIGIQIIQNSISAGAPLEGITTSPDPVVGWGGDTPYHSLPRRRLRRLAVDAFGVEPRCVWRQGPPPNF